MKVKSATRRAPSSQHHNRALNVRQQGAINAYNWLAGAQTRASSVCSSSTFQKYFPHGADEESTEGVRTRSPVELSQSGKCPVGSELLLQVFLWT